MQQPSNVSNEKHKNDNLEKIPELRFPEFNDKWRIYVLKDICGKIENGFSGTQVPFETNFPVTRIETMSFGKINYEKVGYVENIDEKYRLQEGDLLLTHINSLKWIGNVVYFNNKKRLYHEMNLMLLRIKKEFNSKFIYYYITQHNKWFKKMACQAVNQASINKSPFSTIL